MLILEEANLVVLEMPKTATQAVRQTLKRHMKNLKKVRRHAGVRFFEQHVYPDLLKEWDGPVECCCVVREPLSRIQSWYRYRQREKIEGTDNSTAGISFEEFVEALLSDKPPAFAKVGRQAKFTGWNGTEAQIDHVFDYRRLDLYLEFLGERLGTKLDLPRRNQSTAPMPEPLPSELQERFATAFADEYELYQAVLMAGGHLRRGVLRESPQKIATTSG